MCGVTSLGDTLAAMAAGADMIGFNFSPRSPRRVTAEKVAGILKEAPKGFLRVGVFQDAPPAEVAETVKSLGLHWIQLHGGEQVEDYRTAGVPILKAYPVSSAAEVAEAAKSTADVILLDSKSPQGGGSGQTFDWNLVRGLDRKFIVAGGLKPENVAAVVLKLRPYGVDVASGVEKEPGKKDRQLLKAFLQAARRAEEQVFSEVRGR